MVKKNENGTFFLLNFFFLNGESNIFSFDIRLYQRRKKLSIQLDDDEEERSIKISERVQLLLMVQSRRKDELKFFYFLIYNNIVT